MRGDRRRRAGVARPRPPADRPPRAGADRAIGGPHVHPHDPRRRVLPGALPVRSDADEGAAVRPSGRARRPASTATSPTPSRGRWTSWSTSPPRRSTTSTSCSATAGSRCPASRCRTSPGWTSPARSSSVGGDVERGHGRGSASSSIPRWPARPTGRELAGMGDFYGQLGVIGGTVAGGYAERCLVPSTHVHRVPDDVSWHAAAAFPTALPHRPPRPVRVGTPGVRRDGADPRRRQRRVDGRDPAGPPRRSHRARHRRHPTRSAFAATGIGAHHVANNRVVDVAAWAKRGHRRGGRRHGARPRRPGAVGGVAAVVEARAAGSSTAATRPATP